MEKSETEMSDILSAGNVGTLFNSAVERMQDKVALRFRDQTTFNWVNLNWEEYQLRVCRICFSLLEAGLKHGDTVAIISNSRLEWVLCDLAIQSIGCITIPVYQSNMPGEVEYILNHSQVGFVFLEDREQLVKVLEVKDKLPHLEKIVLFEGKVKEDDDLLESFSRLLSRGKELENARSGEYNERLSNVSEDDIATICYTSGTTGPPKGVVLTHKNILSELEGLMQHMIVDASHETLMFLPMAHIFARTGFLVHLVTGNIISFAGSMDTILQDLSEIRPTFIFSVPRIYEKIYAKIISGVSAGSQLKKQIFGFSVFFGRLVSKYKQRGKKVPPWISVFYRMGEMLVFNKIRRLFGGKLQFCISGGAPLAKALAEFFHAAGILVLEGYGLTENVGGGTMNQLDNYKFGTVGKPIKGLQVKIADDGEILFKGNIVFREYFNNQKASEECLLDGWFHTEDIGELDSDGFLKITDRKKDLIVTSGGKNIAPQNLENLLKGYRFISQVMVIGDKRKYLIALFTLNEEEIISFAEKENIEFEEFEELAVRKDVFELIEKGVKSINRDLASYQTIKKFAIIPKEFEIGEELTPTLKVKRKFAMQKYKDVIDSLYGEETGAK